MILREMLEQDSNEVSIISPEQCELYVKTFAQGEALICHRAENTLLSEPYTNTPETAGAICRLCGNPQPHIQLSNSLHLLHDSLLRGERKCNLFGPFSTLEEKKSQLLLSVSHLTQFSSTFTRVRHS